MHEEKTFVTDMAMRDNVTSKKLSKELLESIKLEIETTYPLLRRLKVKRFYHNGRIMARAMIGKRNIRITGSEFNVIQKFANEYQIRSLTANINFNTL